MTYKIEIRGQADEEIYEAYKWYEEQVAGLGHRFIHELESVFQKIATNPQHYKTARSVFRQASLKTLLFVIYFEIVNNAIIVYSVFHTKRKPKNPF